MADKPNQRTLQTALWRPSETTRQPAPSGSGVLSRPPAGTVAGELRRRMGEIFVEGGPTARRKPVTAVQWDQPESHADALTSALVALETTEAEAIYRLALVAELRDNRTAAHIHRVSAYCALLGREIGLPDAEVQLIARAAPLHDLGKLSVSAEILSKPGPLTAEEWESMKQHPCAGASLLSGSPLRLLSTAETIAISHHERWDGSGYPYGLAGESIPLSGRICAIADVFDALTSERPYKPAFTFETAIDVLREGRGSHFDPTLVDGFLACRQDAAIISMDQHPSTGGGLTQGLGNLRTEGRRTRTYH